MSFRKHLRQLLPFPRHDRRRGGKKNLSYRPMLEELESRRVLSDFSLGTVLGRINRDDLVVAGETNNYSFILNAPGELDVQIGSFYPHILATGAPVVDIVLRQQGSSNALVSSSPTPGQHPIAYEHFRVEVPAGSYVLSAVSQESSDDAEYFLDIATDTAPAKPVTVNNVFLGFQDKVSHDFGPLTESPGVDVAFDFLGLLDIASLTNFGDLEDLYTFDVPKDGRVTITVGGLTNSGTPPDIRVELFRDNDHDGLFEPGESINAAEGVSQSYVFDGTLSKGRYALALTSPKQNASGDTPGSTNYNLTINYDVPDLAGDSLATARALTPGPPGLPAVATDYLSPVDAVDDYKFTLGSGGPFIVSAALGGMPADANFDIDILAGTGVVLASGANPFGGEEVTFDTSLAGTYFVQVRRVSGEGPYTLSLTVSNTDHGGGTLATATNIGDLFGRTQLADTLSKVDTADIYKFSLLNGGDVTASFPATALGTDVDLQLIQDKNGNGVVEPLLGEVLDLSNNTGPIGESVSRTNLAAGTYYVAVLWVAGTPAYQMSLTADTAGNTLADDRRMALSGNAASTIEYIGPDDTADFYTVQVAGPIQLNVFLSLFGRSFTLTVGRDANANGVVDPGETLLQNKIATADDARQAVNLPTKGTYFVEVSMSAKATAGTNYGIVLATAPVDNAGDTPAAARNVGVLGATTRTFIDFVGDGSIDTTARGDPVLAADDVDDYYRFTLGTSGPYTFVARLSGLDGNADVELSRDDNLNQKVDEDEILAVSAGTGTFNDVIAKALDTPGTYYLRVYRPGTGTTGSANYTLGMTATSTDTAGNTLATARTIGNLPAPLATSLVASQFVGRIDLDDFYSFTIPAAGNLFVTTTPVNTALVTELIRDADSDFAVDPGETLASSVKALATNGQFTVSLPAAGTYYLHVVSNGIDTNYDVSFAFKNTVGTFVLNPPGTAIDAGDRTKLALDWTVPDGASWHTLQDVQLRFRNFFGTMAIVSFHEADRTLSLFNPPSGKFGPAMAVGSNAVLSNQYVSIFLTTSTVTAAGPTSPTVTLTLDIEFKRLLAGHPVVIEAAASDDFGNVQDFAFAGTLNVRDRHGR